MAKNKDRINARLTAIKTASAAKFDALEPPRPFRNKRAGNRQTVYRFARLVLPDRSVLRCIMKDISQGGAKLVLEGAISVPPRVILKIDQTGETKRARVAWQKDSEVGLQFVTDNAAVQRPATSEKPRRPPE